MKRVDSLAYVRSNPERFFRLGVPSGVEIAKALVGNALLLGASELSVLRLGSWWMVCGNVDWIGEGSDETAFSKIVPFPEAGDNSMRAEILATAFCSAVITSSDGLKKVVSGSVPDGDNIWRELPSSRKWRRVVAFQFDEAGVA